MIKYDAIVFIGRFQPIHVGHLKTIQIALNQTQNLIMIIGSDLCAPSIRQPWSTKQRIMFIKKCLTKSELKKIKFIPIRDRLYSEIIWNQNIEQEIFTYLRTIFSTNKTDFKIGIIGHNKDATSYYLKSFPNWAFIETGNFKNINSTDFRESYFYNQNTNYEFIPKQICGALENFKNTKLFSSLKNEYIFVKKEINKNIYSTHESIPGPSGPGSSRSFILSESNVISNLNPPTLFGDLNKVEANFLILCGNYILLIRRKSHLGFNLYSLPGGEVIKNSNILKNGYVNLLETTNINLTLNEIKKYLLVEKDYNYAQRNPVCNMPTKVFYVKIPTSICPVVSKGTGVTLANWIQLDELTKIENKFYSDHYQILQLILNRIME